MTKIFTHNTNKPILEVSHLSVRYNTRFALEDVSLTLHTGERVAVVGPNGAGKSTLFNAISGVLKPQRGEIKIYGSQPEGHICIAYVPQRNQVDWTFPVTVSDVVMMGRVSKIGLFRHPTRADWELVHRALELVDMASLEKRQIGELSGGQQQRVFIARALAQEAELMLMDEPFTGLDMQSQQSILDILDTLRRRNVTVLVSLHDLNLAAEHFDRILLLNQRVIGFGAPDEALSPERLNEAYKGHLRLIDTPTGIMALQDTCCSHGEEPHRH
ncbi:MAG TPA: metal ABC transporter ATP-binding protein [Anaerolineae bacterium]|nr:metal ABC transporter ATP-binding protein [Anaerolineae bacterium]